MDSLQQQVLNLLSEDWKSRIEIVSETGASEHEVQVALNELQDQIETSYGPVAGLKKARMYRLKTCSQSSSHLRLDQRCTFGCWFHVESLASMSSSGEMSSRLRIQFEGAIYHVMASASRSPTGR